MSGPLAAGVEVLVERFDGSLHVECPWTANVALARAAAARIFRRSFLQVLPSPGEFGNPDGAIVSDDVAYFSRKALAGVYQALLLFPETGAGRRALVWVTDGTPLLSPQSLALSSEQAAAQRKAPPPGAPQWLVAQRAGGPSLDRTVPSIREETLGGWGNLIQRIATKALQREIAIMPVNAQPLDAGLFLGDSAVGAEGARRQAANLPSFATRSDVVHGMTGIGEVTGGEATLLGGHLDRDLRNAVARRSSGYILTFRDPSPQDPRVHDIEIAVSRPDVRLRYRRGFQTFDPLTQLADRVVSNLYVPRPVNPLQATVVAAVLERKPEILTVRLTVTFPALPEAGGLDTRSRTLQVVAACLGPQGEATSPFGETGITRTVYRDDKTLLEHALVIHIRPGKHMWSLGVRDQETGLTSYLSFTTAL